MIERTRHDHPSRDWDFLLSYPRSGNHLVRLLIEVLTRTRTASFYLREGYPMIELPERWGVREDVPPVFRKIHRLRHLDHDFASCSAHRRLILLVRDPYECISSDLRETGCWLRPFRFLLERSKFLENLKDHSRWQGPKHLVHLEDLLETPGRSLGELATFLEAPKSRLDFCLESLNDLLQTGLEALGRKGKSQGDASYYRRRRFLLVPRIPVPRRFEQYLSRYSSVTFY